MKTDRVPTGSHFFAVARLIGATHPHAALITRDLASEIVGGGCTVAFELTRRE